MIINYGNKSIAVQAMRAYVVAATGGDAEAVPDVPYPELG